MNNYENKTLAAKNSIAQRWTQLEGMKGDINFRCELYASWTLPYIFAPEHMKDTEMQSAMDSIGAMCTNHLANKIVKTLFRPAPTPFFRMDTTPLLEKELAKRGVGPDEVEQLRAKLDPQFARTEKQAMREMEKMAYRTAAVEAVKGLIITGNTLLYHPDTGHAQTYNLRDFCVLRDAEGFAVEMMTRDTKAFETFNEEVQGALSASSKHYGATGDPKNNCTVYTHIKFEADGKYHVYQAAEEITLNVDEVYPKDLCPWLPLTWNLSRRDNYGRGLVEDYAGSFSYINMLTLALVEGGAIMCDIKFLVDPASAIDVEELNASKSGTYHQGKEGDITSPELTKQHDFQFIANLIERFERQISMGFTYQQGTTRDAERVTATEIRQDAQELDESFGGVYSKYSETWQRPLARFLLDRIKALADERVIEPVIVTGFDSLSRLGDLDNIQMFFQDLAMLNEVPEDVRAYLNVYGIITVLGTNRGVEYGKFMLTPDQKAANDAAAMKQQQQLMQAQGQANVQEEAGKQAVSQEQ